jgi:hypothetical protein
MKTFALQDAKDENNLVWQEEILLPCPLNFERKNEVDLINRDELYCFGL